MNLVNKIINYYEFDNEILYYYIRLFIKWILALNKRDCSPPKLNLANWQI